MRYLKEFWRVICLHYSFFSGKFLIDAVLLLIVYAVLNSLFWHQSIDDQKVTLVYMYIFFYPLKIMEILIRPKFLYWSIKRQMKKLLNQKLPDDWQIKSFALDSKGMYSWDVEKINKLKNE